MATCSPRSPSCSSSLVSDVIHEDLTTTMLIPRSNNSEDHQQQIYFFDAADESSMSSSFENDDDDDDDLSSLDAGASLSFASAEENNEDDDDYDHDASDTENEEGEEAHRQVSPQANTSLDTDGEEEEDAESYVQVDDDYYFHQAVQVASPSETSSSLYSAVLYDVRSDNSTNSTPAILERGNVVTPDETTSSTTRNKSHHDDGFNARSSHHQKVAQGKHVQNRNGEPTIGILPNNVTSPTSVTSAHVPVSAPAAVTHHNVLSSSNNGARMSRGTQTSDIIDHEDEDVENYIPNQRLRIIAGTYEGSMGTFVRATKCKAWVTVDGYPSGPKALNKGSVVRYRPNCPTMTSSSRTTTTPSPSEIQQPQPLPDQTPSSVPTTVALSPDTAASSTARAPRPNEARSSLSSSTGTRCSHHDVGSTATQASHPVEVGYEVKKEKNLNDRAQPIIAVVPSIVTPPPSSSCPTASSPAPVPSAAQVASTARTVVNEENADTYAPNERLLIIGGTYEGRMGTFVRSTKCKAFVNVDGHPNGPKPLNKTSVQRYHNIADNSTPTATPGSRSNDDNGRNQSQSRTAVPVKMRSNGTSQVSSFPTTSVAVAEVSPYENAVSQQPQSTPLSSRMPVESMSTVAACDKVAIKSCMESSTSHVGENQTTAPINLFPASVTSSAPHALSADALALSTVDDCNATDSNSDNDDEYSFVDEMEVETDDDEEEDFEVLHGTDIPPHPTASNAGVDESVPANAKVGQLWPLDGGGEFSAKLHGALGLNEDRQVLVAPGQRAEKEFTFAFRVFGHRLVIKEIHFNKDLLKLPVTSTNHLGYTYELIFSKIEKMSSGFKVCFKKKIIAAYILTKGPGIPSIDLAQELDRLGGFGCLPTEKIPARLSLVFSPVRKATITKLAGDGYSLSFALTVKDVEELPENANEGCGFIPWSYIQRFLGIHAVGLRTSAIQVRIQSPQLGHFKGMLMVKPDIDKIQLPLSMKKIGPSTVASAARSDVVQVSITKAGLFPSNPNVAIAKILRAEKVAKSFELTKLSKMVQQLLLALGAPKSLVDDYAEKSVIKEAAHVKHAHLVGVADPTNAIPAGHVFVTGAHETNDQIQEEVFVTRYPCTESSDGLVLPLILAKPNGMSEVHWTFLRSLPFGLIVFGDPLPGEAPIPCTIAGGDLDGDLYLMCWSKEILSCIRRDQPPSLSRQDLDSTKKDFRQVPFNREWLNEAQERMADVQGMQKLHELISKLYKLWEMNPTTRDGMAFGRAYKEAIDLGKHGGQVILPSYLWNEVPQKLHSQLTCPYGPMGPGPGLAPTSRDQQAPSTTSPSLSRTRAAVGTQASPPSTSRSLIPGEAVFISGGTHKGKRGTFLRWTPADKACVQVEGLDSERYLAPKNVEHDTGGAIRTCN